jgi:thiamine biosynthesis lipoprotein
MVDKHALTHEAMAAVFTITVADQEATYARQATAEVFAELDRIELRLSRFIEGSDIFRINRLAAGQSTVVGLDTFECLKTAEEIRQATGCAFDVAYASVSSASAGPRFELDSATHSVRVLSAGMRLDLGGIGKGFALDRMAAILREWDIPYAMLAASTSTVLALEPPPGESGWPIRVGTDDGPDRLKLVRAAVSASGLSVKGNHIIDPRTGRAAEGRDRVWCSAPTAAVADALSTAFMVMTVAEIESFCRTRPEISPHLPPPQRR